MPFDRIVRATVLDNLPKSYSHRKVPAATVTMATSATRADQRLWYYSAPAHRVRATVEYLRHATTDFIDTSGHLIATTYPVDYRILGLSSRPCLSEAHTRHQRAETAPG